MLVHIRVGAYSASKSLIRIYIPTPVLQTDRAEHPPEMAHAALPSIIAELAAGTAAAASRPLQEAARNSAAELSNLTLTIPEFARRVAEEPGTLPALVASVAAGGTEGAPILQDAATSCSAVLFQITKGGPELARRVVDVPGAIHTLVTAVRAGSMVAAPSRLQDAAANSAKVLAQVVTASPAIA